MKFKFDFEEKIHFNRENFGGYDIETVRFFFGLNIPRWNGEWGWCLYIYIKPEHSLYERFNNFSDENDPMFKVFPFHGGCTFAEKLPDGTLKIGCDFSHGCDDGCHDWILPEKVLNNFLEIKDFMANLT